MPSHPSLSDYVQQLKDKGFTEEALDISTDPRTIEPSLRGGFAEYLPLAKESGKEKGFFLEIPAAFKEDIVRFDLLFVIDPAKENVRLHYIRTNLDGVTDKVFTLDGQLKETPQELYQRVLRKKAERMSQVIKATAHKPRDKKIHL
jgi:hypothetical protein